MPWYTPWSDDIAKRVCKYLLQRYLGQFLKEKLTLDQLTVNLYKGIGTVSNVALDVEAINDLMEQQSIPLEFLDGFISEMSVSVPWSSLLSDASHIEVTGLTLTVKYKERDKARASMFESMWSSMTSSMQLAEECLKNERETLNEDAAQSFEGIERFAHTIDSILSRIQVKFMKTVIRIEQCYEGQSSGVGLEVDIQLMDYFDEASVETVDDPKTEFQLPAFSTKKIYMDGVTFYSDEFLVSSSNDNKMDQSAESVDDSGSEDSSESSSATNTNILIAKLAGRQEVVMKFRQEGIAGPKVELGVNLGALTIFASPRQAHQMFGLISSMTNSGASNPSSSVLKMHNTGKPMGESDFRKIEHELQLGLNPMTLLQEKGLGAQGWCNTSIDGSDDEFSPLHNASRMADSVASSASSLSSSTSSISSARSSQLSYAQQPHRSRKSHTGTHMEEEGNSSVFYFHIVLSSTALVLLHDDILTVSVDSTTDIVTPSSLEQMKRLAEDFFYCLGHFAVSGYGNKDFESAKSVFLKACQLNHIRFIAAPVILEANETSTAHTSVIKGTCTAASVELLECIIEKETHSQQASIDYVQLLKFIKHTSFDKREAGPGLFESRPSVQLNFKLCQTSSKHGRGRKVLQPRSEFSFTLQPFLVEVDLTIVDRISALLHPDITSSASSVPKYKCNPFQKTHFEEAAESHLTISTKYSISLTSSFITLKVRFPTPDLRPIHDMDKPPWWRRSVRSDVLFVDITDLTFHTKLDNHETVSKYEVQFRELLAKFQEADTDVAVPFAKASVDPHCNTILDGGQGFGWPNIVIQVYPESNHTELEDEHSFSSHKAFSHSFAYQSVITTLESTTKRETSPFSCKKVVHESDTPHSKAAGPDQEGEELVIPGDKAEIAEFIDIASVNTRVKLDISLPTASLVFPSKHFYELIYNRISSDLLLWEPSAPVRINQNSHMNMNLSFHEDILRPVFSLCKSGIQFESDSDSESQEGMFYSVHEQNMRHKRRQQMETSVAGQSRLALQLSVGQGICELFTPARDTTGSVIPSQHGQLFFSLDESNLFYVSGYKGKSDMDYMCVQVNHLSFHHNGLIGDGAESRSLKPIGSSPPSCLRPLIYLMERTASVDQTTQVGTGSAKSLDMLTVALRIQKDKRSHKTFRVATGIRNATLRHVVCSGQTSWFSQLVDFFDVDDYPVAGYEPSIVLTEINLHLWNCDIDYRPLYLPIRSLLTVGNFNISSNIAAKTSSSTLRFIAEDAAFFISDKTGVRLESSPVDLRRDYICVLELGLFELSLRLCEQSSVNPKVDLRASTNVVHIRTCSDSAKALTELLMYFASDGDLVGGETEPEEREKLQREETEEVLVEMVDDDSIHVLSKSQVALVNDLMEEAMKESKLEPGRKVYFEPDDDTIAEDAEQEQQHQPQQLGLGSELCEEVAHDFDLDKDDSWEKEFCILDNEAGIGILPKKGLPEVRCLTSEPLRLVDNHFSIPLGKADLLRSPKHYPQPVVRYTLREMSLIWHMYGGSDFDTSKPSKHVKIDDQASEHSIEPSARVTQPGSITFSKGVSGVKFEVTPESSAPAHLSWKEKGGAKRRHDILMELQLNKIRYQHEVYPESTVEASRQVLLVSELELRDRLATSHINKFLYQYSSEAMPRQSHANMLVVKAVLLRSDPKMNAQECCLKVSLLPLRLNIDQDSLLFLYSFFNEISVDYKEEEVDISPAPSSRVQTPTHQVPVMTVRSKGKSDSAEEPPPPLAPPLILLDEVKHHTKKEKAAAKSSSSTKPPAPPVFFRCFIFSPEVPVKLDYQGKRVDMTHGPLAGLLMGLGQLNNSELKLRRISHRHGLLGFDKLLNFVLSEWTNDIKKNQLPSLLGGVGPMHSLIQLFHGIRDLFWLPIEQYQRDGRLVRGFQRGANSFTTSTAMAALELTSRLIQIIQSTAETAYDMVSPGPSVRSRRSGKGKRRTYSQPADIREGVTNAILVVKEGIGETAETILRVASEEHEQKGVTGAVGGVLRQIPPTVVKPIILATEATNNVIGGMRSQLVPDARKEAVEKWRKQDS